MNANCAICISPPVIPGIIGIVWQLPYVPFSLTIQDIIKDLCVIGITSGETQIEHVWTTATYPRSIVKSATDAPYSALNMKDKLVILWTELSSGTIGAPDAICNMKVIPSDSLFSVVIFVVFFNA